MRPLALLLLTIISALAADAPLLRDDFSAPKNDQRRAMRGDWKFADNTATCTQDDELFKKNKDHGPILFYDLAYTDAAIRFAVKPDASTKTIVFTANGAEGHVFRLVFGAAGMAVRAFPTDSKDHKSIALANEATVKLKPGEWTNVSVELRGPKATVKVDDFTQTYDHASLSAAKTNLSVGFSFGTVSVKDVVVEK
ncbi:MAG: hypothetical protein JNG86_04865 [Verrucomicrobiaceae bacterium]|nr:hypothetical protein [Verrucomicrobiaceae bacterium]